MSPSCETSVRWTCPGASPSCRATISASPTAAGEGAASSASERRWAALSGEGSRGSTTAIQDASAPGRCALTARASAGARVLLAELLELLGRRAGRGLLVRGRAVLRGGRGRGRGRGARVRARLARRPGVAGGGDRGGGRIGAGGLAGARGGGRRHVGGALLVRHAERRRGPRNLLDGGGVGAAARRGDRKAEKRQQKGGAEPAHGGRGQRGSAAMRRPQVGQSLRSFCDSWSHQLQKRRFSVAHGSWDFDGESGRTLPTTSSGSPVSRSTKVCPGSASSRVSRPVEGVRRRYFWPIGAQTSSGARALRH